MTVLPAHPDPPMDERQFRGTTFRRLLAAGLSDAISQRLADQITRDASQYAANTAEAVARPPDHWGTK